MVKDFACCSSLVPPFEEGDIVGCFRLFEKLANKQKKPKEYWTNFVGTKLSAKSLRV